MGLRLTALALVVTGCGRLGFEAHLTDAAGQPGDGDPDVRGDAAPDAAPPALAQASTVTSSTGNMVLALPAASTAGTLLVATIATNSTGGVVLPTGWLLAQQGSTGGACDAVIAYYPANPGGITTATFMQGSLVPGEGVISEWAGISGATPLDATGTAAGASPVTAQPVPTTTAAMAAGELAITSYCEDANSPSYTADPAWTRLGTFSNTSASPSYESDYQLGVPAATITETATSSVAGKYNAAIATFAP